MGRSGREGVGNQRYNKAECVCVAGRQASGSR